MTARTQGTGQGAEASSPPRGKRPRLIGAISWGVLIASFALSFATWADLAVIAGFRAEAAFTLQGIRPRLAWLLPAAYDGYVMVSLITWQAPVPQRVADFARKNTYVSACLGVIVQASYHANGAWHEYHAPPLLALAAFVGSIPVAVSALSIHLRALVAHEGHEAPRGPRLAQWVASTRDALAPRPEPRPEPAEAPPPPVVPLPSPEPSPAPSAPVRHAPKARPAADELAPRRAARAQDVDTWAETLYEAWGHELPTGARAKAKSILRVGSDKADAAIREFMTRYATAGTENVK